MKDPESFPFPSAATDTMLGWVREHIRQGPDPKHGAQSPELLDRGMGGTITDTGLGANRAFEIFTRVILPATRPMGHPSSLAFVSSAPSCAALSFDAALGAAGIFAGNWDGGAGAIHAENQVLGWLGGLAGWPETLGGVFVAGGTLGNLSALHAARERRARMVKRPERWAILCSTEAHSSIHAAARVMDVDVIPVETDRTGRMSAQMARRSLAETPGAFAVVGNAGATNSGAIDDLDGLGQLTQERGLWLHVDGAYGLAAMADPDSRPRFKGIERADSMIVDPHKWLFAPYDSCALLYRNAADGRAAHGQQAVYLDAMDNTQFNPSDYALHLTRRARGLPLWFSLAVHGTEAYGKAIAKTLKTAREIANGIVATPGLELLLGPQLSVILFKPNAMSDATMAAWAEVHRRTGTILCLPTTWQGEKVFRLCIVNPETDAEEILAAIRTLCELQP